MGYISENAHWLELKWNQKPPELRLMYFRKQDSGSYWSVPVWSSALFVKPHAKNAFNKLALNTDFSSSSSSKLPLRVVVLLLTAVEKQLHLCKLNFHRFITKIDKCIHERVCAVTLASCAVMYPVTDHPSRFLQKTEQSTSLLGFQGGNRAPRNINELSFPSVIEKDVHIPYEIWWESWKNLIFCHNEQEENLVEWLKSLQ